MSESNGHEPAVVEFGRYRMYEAPEGLVLARAADTCERCQSCGCGDQQPLIELPDPRRGRVAMMSWLAANANKGLLGALAKGLSGGG